MGSWLRENAAVLFVGLLILGTVSGWVRAAEYRGEARVHRQAAVADSIRADSIQALRRAEARADSLRWQATLDSMATRAARADSARQREAEARRAQERARARALAAAETLVETLSPAQVPLFDAYRSERDREVDELVVQVESRGRRIAELESENVTLFRSRESMAELYDAAVAEGAALRDANVSIRASLDAMERAESAGGLLPDLEAFTDPLLIAGGALLGYTVAQIR